MGELSEASAVPEPGTTSKRIERKYLLPSEKLDEAVEAVAARVPLFRYHPEQTWTSLRTTYLDTHDHACYQEYLQNLPVRRKIRVRQYGVNGHFGDGCWVELKVKNRGLSLKRRFRFQVDALPALLAGDNLIGAVRQWNRDRDVDRIYEAVRNMLTEQRLIPVVRLDYERLAFQKAPGAPIRVTLDRDVQFISADQALEGALPGVVLELKHNGKRPDWLRPLRKELGTRRRKRFSKFARSMGQLDQLRYDEASS